MLLNKIDDSVENLEEGGGMGDDADDDLNKSFMEELKHFHLKDMQVINSHTTNIFLYIKTSY